MDVAFIRCDLILRAFNPDQPRIPAGSSNGGQWTAGDGSDVNLASDDPHNVHINDPACYKYNVLLYEEGTRGAHTIYNHVGKTDMVMMKRIQNDRYETPFVTIGRQRDGSFDSIESANDFVNRTLKANKETVDAVARGEVDRAFVKQRFGYRTGREAYRSNMSDPHMRNTYGVGVEIRQDRSSSRGFRVHAAYPRNDGE